MQPSELSHNTNHVVHKKHPLLDTEHKIGLFVFLVLALVGIPLTILLNKTSRNLTFNTASSNSNSIQIGSFVPAIPPIIPNNYSTQQEIINNITSINPNVDINSPTTQNFISGIMNGTQTYQGSNSLSTYIGDVKALPKTSQNPEAPTNQDKPSEETTGQSQTQTNAASPQTTVGNTSQTQQQQTNNQPPANNTQAAPNQTSQTPSGNNQNIITVNGQTYQVQRNPDGSIAGGQLIQPNTTTSNQLPSGSYVIPRTNAVYYNSAYSPSYGNNPAPAAGTPGGAGTNAVPNYNGNGQFAIFSNTGQVVGFYNSLIGTAYNNGNNNSATQNTGSGNSAPGGVWNGQGGWYFSGGGQGTSPSNQNSGLNGNNISGPQGGQAGQAAQNSGVPSGDYYAPSGNGGYYDNGPSSL